MYLSWRLYWVKNTLGGIVEILIKPEKERRRLSHLICVFAFLQIGSPIMPEKAAKNFLHSLRKRSRTRRASTSAVEECCLEGCSIEEITEYHCFR